MNHIVLTAHQVECLQRGFDISVTYEGKIVPIRKQFQREEAKNALENGWPISDGAKDYLLQLVNIDMKR